MTPDESNLLSEAARSILMDTILTLVGVVLVTSHAMLSFFAIWSLRNRRLKTAPYRWFIAAVAATVGLMITSASIYIATVVRALEYGFIDNQEIPLAERWSTVVIQNTTLGRVALCIWSLTFLTGDFVAAWRAYVICRSQRVLVCVAAFLTLASGVFVLLPSFLPVQFNQFELEKSTTSVQYTVVAGIGAAGSLLANIVTTSMLAHYAYMHRSVGLGPWRILTNLVEMGAIYFIFQVLLIVLFFASWQTTKMLNYIYDFWYMLTLWYSACSLPIVILIVAHNGSLADDIAGNSNPSRTGGPVLTSHIPSFTIHSEISSFAANRASVGFDLENKIPEVIQ